LTKRHLTGDMAMSTAQFDYKRKLEEYYIERIERILMPIIGFDGVRAQVDADIDFSVTESTQESFNPDLPAIRSEQTQEEESRGGDTGGVPGALTNQPPGATTVPEQATGEDGSKSEAPSRKSKRSTFNYELDKTISHTKKAPGVLKKLSVAVVVDNKLVVKDAEVSHIALTPEEVDRLTGLVKEAVGFNIQRGDSVTITNAKFRSSDELPPPPKPPIWEQPWFIDLAKQAAGVLMALVLILMLVKPVLKELAKKEELPEEEEEVILEEEEDVGAALLRRRDKLGLTAEDWAALGMSAEEYEEMLKVLRQMVIEDPRLVAQVIKTWVAEDEVHEKAMREAEKEKG
ncbi:MAG: flagellar basal-body MS-ring/collar protein FliF, partial [Gammaproteobacteria bacterium]|nr:flagellar basal-body MS-ring/collar protein FliF [Gammaproteobacteria bacterium]